MFATVQMSSSPGMNRPRPRLLQGTLCRHVKESTLGLSCGPGAPKLEGARRGLRGLPPADSNKGEFRTATKTDWRARVWG
jgi:hypothetical protein